MRRLLFIAAVLVGLVVTAITYAAAGRQLAAVTNTAPTTTATAPSVVLVVPDIRREAFVFAKEQLQDGGFAWKVVGGVDGFAANTVVSQTPPPGTRLLDTGAPLVTITLSRNKQYRPVGEPQNTSPYPSTPNRLAGTS